MSQAQARRSMFYAEQAKRRAQRTQARRSALRVGPAFTKSEITNLIRKNAGEKKSIDISIASLDFAATTNTNDSAILINRIQDGSALYQRVGKKVFCKSVRLYGQCVSELKPDGTTADLDGITGRIVVVWDKEASGSTIPTFDSVFGRIGETGSAACTFLDPPQVVETERYKVLKDYRFDMNPEAGIPSGGTQNSLKLKHNFDLYINLRNAVSVYKTTSNPITYNDLANGALVVYFRADANTNLFKQVSTSANSFARLRYSD